MIFTNKHHSQNDAAYDPLISNAVSPLDKPPETYWHANHTPTYYHALFDNINCDFLVIGGGYTGLSAAITLAEHNQDVVLIDSHNVGFGCSGRNAGFVLNGSGRLSLHAIEQKWGKETALGMQQEFSAAVSLLNHRVQHYNMHIDAAYGDYIKLAHTPKHAQTMCHNAHIENTQYANTLRILSKSELARTHNIQGVYGGVAQKGLCINPLKLADEYARVAVECGAALYYQTPALSLQKSNNHYLVTTPKGRIRAKKVLIATNAYTPKQFHALVDGRQFPVQSSILVSAPMNNRQRQATGLTSTMSFMDTRMMKYYYRVLPDGRLLFGGRGAITGAKANHHSHQNRLRAAMIRSFPDLSDIPIDYYWSGWVSVALDSLPRIITSDNNQLGYAMGYCGSGVSFSAFAGKRLAERMLGVQVNQALPIYSSELVRYPLPFARRIALWALYQWARVVER